MRMGVQSPSTPLKQDLAEPVTSALERRGQELADQTVSIKTVFHRMGKLEPGVQNSGLSLTVPQYLRSWLEDA